MIAWVSQLWSGVQVPGPKVGTIGSNVNPRKVSNGKYALRLSVTESNPGVA